MGSDADKLAAPKLFGRKKSSTSTPKPAAEPVDAPVVEPASPQASGVETTEPTRILEPVEEPTAEPTAEKPAKAEKPPKQPKPAKASRPPRDIRVPTLSGGQAAAFTGLLVGAFLVLATYGCLRGCSAIRGTSTCGGAAGFPLLLAIGIVAVVGGAVLLRAFRVSSPGSDSFLAVALVAVLATLFLGDHYDSWWIILVIPVLTIASFSLAHWVSVRFIDRADE